VWLLVWVPPPATIFPRPPSIHRGPLSGARTFRSTDFVINFSQDPGFFFISLALPFLNDVLTFTLVSSGSNLKWNIFQQLSVTAFLHHPLPLLPSQLAHQGRAWPSIPRPFSLMAVGNNVPQRFSSLVILLQTVSSQCPFPRQVQVGLFFFHKYPPFSLTLPKLLPSPRSIPYVHL